MPDTPAQPKQGKDWSWDKFLQWLMAHGALQKAAGVAPPPRPTDPGADPYKYMRDQIQANPGNLPLNPEQTPMAGGNMPSPAPDPGALRVLGVPKRKLQ